MLKNIQMFEFECFAEKRFDSLIVKRSLSLKLSGALI